jgi:hypothetical protein
VRGAELHLQVLELAVAEDFHGHDFTGLFMAKNA